MNKTVLILFIASALTMFSCKKDKTEEKKEIPIEFKIRVLNTQGIETDTFNEGENIIFSFLMTNITDEYHPFDAYGMNLTDFFKLYKASTNGQKILIGKPYEFLFCDKVGFVGLNAGAKVDITIPWLYDDKLYSEHTGCGPFPDGHEETTTLPKGEYYTSFSSTFTIDNNKTETLFFETKFTVK